MSTTVCSYKHKKNTQSTIILYYVMLLDLVAVPGTVTFYNDKQDSFRFLRYIDNP